MSQSYYAKFRSNYVIRSAIYSIDRHVFRPNALRCTILHRFFRRVKTATERNTSKRDTLFARAEKRIFAIAKICYALRQTRPFVKSKSDEVANVASYRQSAQCFDLYGIIQHIQHVICYPIVNSMFNLCPQYIRYKAFVCINISFPAHSINPQVQTARQSQGLSNQKCACLLLTNSTHHPRKSTRRRRLTFGQRDNPSDSQ